MMIFMETAKQLPDYIRSKMKEQNLSAHDVARRSGNEVSPTTITKILNGEVNRSGTRTLALIAKGLGVSELEMLRVANGDDISRPLHYQVYAERFDAGDLSDTEWQFLEAYFHDTVERFKAGRAERDAAIEKMIERTAKTPAPVVATITPPLPPEREPTRDAIQRMITGDEIDEIKRRVTPRKKKAG